MKVKEKNWYKLFVIATGQDLRFHSWKRRVKNLGMEHSIGSKIQEIKEEKEE